MMRAERCYYTGIELTPGGRPGASVTTSSATIDRVDHTKGYVKGNVVACCRAFNELKGFAERLGIQITQAVIELLREACVWLHERGIAVLNRWAFNALCNYNKKFSIFFQKPLHVI